MRRSILLSLMLLLLLASLVVKAQPITRVYRPDSRPPHVVFMHGLEGRGTRLDVLGHAIGGDCAEADPTLASAWVSTTHDRNQAEGFAEGLLRALEGTHPNPVVWLYTIRADNTYMVLERLLRQAIREGEMGSNTYTADHARVLRWLIARTSIGVENEVITHYVDRTNIVEAVPLRYVGDTLVEGLPMRNAAYLAANTEADSQVQTLAAFVPPASIRMDLYEGDRASRDSCSMSCDSSRSSSPSLLAATSPPTGHCSAYRARLLTPVLRFLLLS